MKTAVLLFVILILGQPVFSQYEYADRLCITERFESFGISPSGEIWVPTCTGQVYYTAQMGKLWHSIKSDSVASTPINGNFEYLDFLSEDTLMIAGYSFEHSYKSNEIYWSGDHGKTWKTIKFGENTRHNGHYVHQGKIWVGADSSLVHYSEDYGKTWKRLDQAKKIGDISFGSVYFAPDDKTGLFGTWSNALYRTPDNCETWEKLPTPLDQKKFQASSEYPNSGVYKAQIIGDSYIIKQEEEVFASNSDQIAWKHIPNALDFDVNSAQTKLFIVEKDGKVACYDTAFALQWRSTKAISDLEIIIKAQGDYLFVMEGCAFYKIGKNTFTLAELFTNDRDIYSPSKKIKYQGELFGLSDGDLLHFDTKRKKWHRYISRDFWISRFFLFNGQLILYNESKPEYYSVDYTNQTLQPYSLPTKIFDLEANPVVELKISEGRSGCFHLEQDRKTYVHKNRYFELASQKLELNYLQKLPNKIRSKAVHQLVQAIDRSRYEQLSIKELRIKPKDIKQFHRFIDQQANKPISTNKEALDHFSPVKFPTKNVDFQVYKNIADTIANVSPKRLNDLFLSFYSSYSTDNNWRQVEFVFRDGTKLTVKNTDEIPGYFYAPWKVDYEGVFFEVTAINFAKMLNRATQRAFFSKSSRSKTLALFQLTNMIYRRHLLRNQGK